MSDKWFDAFQAWMEDHADVQMAERIGLIGYGPHLIEVHLYDLLPCHCPRGIYRMADPDGCPWHEHGQDLYEELVILGYLQGSQFAGEPATWPGVPQEIKDIVNAREAT